MSADTPTYRPLERFWPYAEVTEQPSPEELAALEPELHDALFGATARPFSISLVFPHLDVPGFDEALAAARGAAECRETSTPDGRRYRVRFLASDAARLRDVFQVVGQADATDVLIDDQPVPFARELWLPLVWYLLPR